MALFEELELPVVLYAPHLEDGWRKTLKARWVDLEVNMKVRDETAAGLINDAATFAAALDVLRPVMAHRPDMTVEQALAELEGVTP